MYLRLHNSCTYSIYNEYFEIRSSVFDLFFKINGISAQSARRLLNQLQVGVEIKGVIEFLAAESQCTQKKTKELIDFLTKRKLLIKRERLVDSPLQNTLYDRQIRFLDSFENEDSSGTDFNNRLQERKVVIVGLGAYGTWLALHCARLGVKHIVGIDFDTVELSNLHRQVLYTQDDIGLAKAIACKKLLTVVDSSIQYDGYCRKIENEIDLVPFLEKADLVFNAFGYYSANEACSMIPGFIAKACIKTKTPMLCLSTSWVGPLYISGRSACYFCAVQHPKLEMIIHRNIRNPRIDKRAFCPVLSLSCSLAALEASRFLSGIDQPRSIGGVIALDPFKMDNSHFVPVPIAVSCTYCNNKENIHGRCSIYL